MEAKKKFSNLKIVKDKGLEIKEEPMAQINAVIKKLKKKQKIKNEDLSDMYNEKCASLCDKIESNKIEIENYKTIIFQTQQSIRAKDHEIEELTNMMINYKKKAEELEKKINEKKEEKNINEIKEEKKEEKNVNLNYTNEITEFKKEIDQLKNENEELKKENEELKNNYNKKLQETENFYKNIISENEKQITELRQKIEELEKNKNNEIKENKKEENNDAVKKEEKINTDKIEEEMPIIKIDDELKNIEIPKQETRDHKMLIFNNVVAENLFLYFLHCRSFSYGRIIKELVNNFDKYSTNFLKDRLKINNIFSQVLYDFFYRSYRRTDLNEFVQEIFEINSVTQNEDFKNTISENQLFSQGYVDKVCIQIVNQKINQYKAETYNNIKELVIKCRDYIKSTSLLDNIKKYEPYLYTINKSKIQINLNFLSPESIGHLVTGIKYSKNKIRTVEFVGDLNYDNHNECFYTYDVFYQLVASHGEYINEIYFNNIKKFSIYKLISLTYTTNYFIKGINILLRGCPNLKNFNVNNCDITDDNMNDFEFPENHEYSIINFANNKIYKLKNFKKIKTIQLILNHNKIKLYQGDNNISITYLDISSCDFSIKDFNKFMGQSAIKILNLSDTKITKEDEGNNLSNTFNTIKDLQIIYLNNCQLNIKSLTPLLNNIKNMNILEIYLSGNPFGNECMKLISDFIENCKTLQKIDLSGTKITTEGIEEIVDGVKANDKIKEIVLQNISNIDKNKIEEMFKYKEDFNITF